MEVLHRELLGRGSVKASPISGLKLDNADVLLGLVSLMT